MKRPIAPRPAIDRSFVQGIGRHAENVRIRRANLEVNRRCLAELEKRGRGVDIFRRTLPRLKEIIRFEEAALKIAESVK